MRRRDLAGFAVSPDPFTRLKRPVGDATVLPRVIFENDDFPISRCGLNRRGACKKTPVLRVARAGYSAGSGTSDLTLVNKNWAPL